MYWYIDEEYIGTTKDIHELAIIPKLGEHLITVVDELGNEAKRKISISE